MKKFSGVAYWSVSKAPADWMDKAEAILNPLETAALGSVIRSKIPAGDQIQVAFESDPYEIVLTGGSGRGVVRETATSGRWIMCLVALRRKLGYLDVVTDSQESVPATPRQSYQLYEQDWDAVLAIARVLGLASDERFNARNNAVLSRMF